MQFLLAFDWIYTVIGAVVIAFHFRFPGHVSNPDAPCIFVKMFL